MAGVETSLIVLDTAASSRCTASNLKICTQDNVV